MSGHRSICVIGALVIGLMACGDGDEAGQTTSDRDTAAPQHATALASGSAELSAEELEAGRMDPGWRQHLERDGQAASARGDGASTDTSAAGTAEDESAGSASNGAGGANGTPSDSLGWDQISRQTVNAAAESLPIHGDVEGPSVARVQILLDKTRFSPGVIDGRWGKNTEKAVYWFQESNGLEATGEVDQRTLEALERGGAGELITTRTLTEADVSGPFVELPEDVYERAELECLCYESQREQIAEVFHSTPELLEQLNPDVDLNTIAAGASLDVPAVDPFHLDDLPDGKYTGGGEVARIIISDGGHYVQAENEAGEILYHFPSTLGADYAPSPEGDYSVESITFDPTWHYQPELLSRVDPSKDDAVLPAGPNNAVGIVWMSLSKPHYGIHGTSAPETIGYATSHGCVRLTNWDAGFLAQRVPPGTPVEFTNLTGRGG